MKSNVNYKAKFSNSYLAADEEMSTPESVNNYLASILMPEVYGPVPIPDGDTTPIMLKAFMTEAVLNWVSGNATVLAVWTPASPSALLKLFVSIPGQPWAHLQDIPLSQDLNENYQKARLISAVMVARSASQAAGVFTLAGEATSVYVNVIPPFSELTYNTLLSWIPNGGSAVKGVPVQDGVLALWNPNGYKEFWNPEAPWSYRFQELWDVNFNPDGWVFNLAPYVFPAGDTIIWDSANATNFSGFPFGPLPDPFWGDWSALILMSLSAPVFLSFSLNIQFYDADPLTWDSVLHTVTMIRWGEGPNPAGDYGRTSINTPIITTPANIIRIYIVMTAAAAGTLTSLSPPQITITSYDYYKPNTMSPAVVSMMTRVNQNQPVSLGATYNYELVPNPLLARNVTVTTKRGDPAGLEAANAVLDKVGSGVNLIWNKKDYDLAISKMFFHRLASGQTAFEAAGPSLKSRLMGIWKAVNPMLSEFGVAAARGGLSMATAKYPMLAPMTSFLDDQYLSSGSGSMGRDDWFAAGVEPETDGGDKGEGENNDSGEIFAESFLKTFEHELPDTLPIPPMEAVRRVIISSASDLKKLSQIAGIVGYIPTVPLHPDDNGQYEAADVEEDSELVLAQPRIQNLVPSSDFVNIVNGKASPLEAPRAAYFVIVPGPENLTGTPQIVRIVISAEALPSRDYRDTGIVTSSGVSIHVTAFFFSKIKLAFLQNLVSYGVSSGIISKDSAIYFSVDSPLKINGPSWELAALVAMLGIAGDAIYSGKISWEDPYSPSVGQVGEVALKAGVAAKIGVKLVTATDISPADTTEILTNMGFRIMYPGFLCSGRPIPAGAVVLAIQSPFDVVLFNLRLMKHRLNMSAQEQLMMGTVKNLPKKNKMPPEGLEAAKNAALGELRDLHSELLALIRASNLSNHEIGKSVNSKLQSWTSIISQSGTPDAVRFQLDNIQKSAQNIRQRINAAAANGAGSGARATAKRTKTSAARERMLSRMTVESTGRHATGKGKEEDTAEAFMSDLGFG